jgi:hypothetical protein
MIEFDITKILRKVLQINYNIEMIYLFGNLFKTTNHQRYNSFFENIIGRKSKMNVLLNDFDYFFQNSYFTDFLIKF